MNNQVKYQALVLNLDFFLDSIQLSECSCSHYRLKFGSSKEIVTSVMWPTCTKHDVTRNSLCTEVTTDLEATIVTVCIFSF